MRIMTKHFYIRGTDAKKRIQLTDQRRSSSDMLHAFEVDADFWLYKNKKLGERNFNNCLQ